MSSKTQYLVNQKLIQPPKWLVDNVCYEVITGSKAYGVSEDNSDMDIYGWCIPLKHDIFPHLQGLIPGFDNIQNFEQFQQHGIYDNKDLLAFSEKLGLNSIPSLKEVEDEIKSRGLEQSQ
jgi:hypothetical protein